MRISSRLVRNPTAHWANQPASTMDYSVQGEVFEVTHRNPLLVAEGFCSFIDSE